MSARAPDRRSRGDRRLETASLAGRRFTLAITPADCVCFFARAPATARPPLRHAVVGERSAVGVLLRARAESVLPVRSGRTGYDSGAHRKRRAADAAATAVFYNRVFEVLAITLFLVSGFIYLGWGGAVEPFFWTVILIAGVVSLTRPLGRGQRVERPVQLRSGTSGAPFAATR